MNRYFIYLSYDGARYHGWQRQPNSSSVEETVERSLSLLLRRDVNIVGAGRTDTGVNASSMPAHFDVESDDETLFTKNNGETFVHKLQYKLTHMQGLTPWNVHTIIILLQKRILSALSITTGYLSTWTSAG